VKVESVVSDSFVVFWKNGDEVVSQNSCTWVC